MSAELSAEVVASTLCGRWQVHIEDVHVYMYMHVGENGFSEAEKSEEFFTVDFVALTPI